MIRTRNLLITVFFLTLCHIYCPPASISQCWLSIGWHDHFIAERSWVRILVLLSRVLIGAATRTNLRLFFSLFCWIWTCDLLILHGPFPNHLTDLIFIELSSCHLFSKSDSPPSNEALDLLERRCHFPDYGCFSKKMFSSFLKFEKMSRRDKSCLSVHPTKFFFTRIQRD